MKPQECAILVPVSGMVEPECEEALSVLRERGYAVQYLRGNAAVDQARNLMATRALDRGYKELFWIDSDIGFSPDDVEKLRAHNLPMVCGLYPKKGERAVACHVVPGTHEIVFGKKGGLVEILYAGTGFLLTRCEVYTKIKTDGNLPTCNVAFGEGVVPYFLPMVIPHGTGHWYLGEDYAFCERARQSHFQIFADTTVRLKHIGRYAYEWEDTGTQLQRYSSFRLNLKPKT
ncbi:MAG: hypothetical protein IPK82_22015 [Polyangiaceae bacterium]|nr:hypothetical protein [Polyangiaceae bacterium]